MKKNNYFEKICLIVAIILLIYIIVCNFFVTFSLTVTLYFATMIFLLFALAYTYRFPIKKSERGPSFRYVFIKVASLLFFSATFLILIFNIFYPKRLLSKEKRFDYIIVFGAGITSGKNEIMNNRLEKAVEYADIYKNCKFVLTGAKGKEEPIEEAIYMKNYMAKYGVSERRVIVDPFSTNTEENIENAFELIYNDVMKRNIRERIVVRPFKFKKGYFDMDFLNIGFMSSDFHLTRINMMARKQGVREPYSINCNTNILYMPYMYIRENLSIFKALVLNQLKL